MFVFTQQRNSAVMNQARETTRRIGLELIEQKRSEVIAEMQTAAGKNGIEGDKTVLGRDLLSVLSMSTSYPYPFSHRSFYHSQIKSRDLISITTNVNQ